jgi:hypothetical protein
MDMRAMRVGETYTVSSRKDTRSGYERWHYGTYFPVEVIAVARDKYTEYAQYGYRGRQLKGVTVRVLETLMTKDENGNEVPVEVRLPKMLETVPVRKGAVIVISGASVVGPASMIEEHHAKEKAREEKWVEEKAEAIARNLHLYNRMMEAGLEEWAQPDGVAIGDPEEDDDADEWTDEDRQTAIYYWRPKSLPYGTMDQWQFIMDTIDKAKKEEVASV